MNTKSFHYNSVFWELLVLLLTALSGTGIAERLTVRDVEVGSGMDANSTADPLLTGSAIANITASAVAICIIFSVLCYLGLVYNKQERMDRVRMAMERNRQIDRQLAATRARQQQKAEDNGGKEGQDGGKAGQDEGAPPPGDEPLLFSAVHTSHRQVDADEEQPLVSYRQPGDSRWNHGSTGATTTTTVPIAPAQDTANLP